MAGSNNNNKTAANTPTAGASSSPAPRMTDPLVTFSRRPCTPTAAAAAAVSQVRGVRPSQIPVIGRSRPTTRSVTGSLPTQRAVQIQPLAGQAPASPIISPSTVHPSRSYSAVLTSPPPTSPVASPAASPARNSPSTASRVPALITHFEGRRIIPSSRSATPTGAPLAPSPPSPTSPVIRVSAMMTQAKTVEEQLAEIQAAMRERDEKLRERELQRDLRSPHPCEASSQPRNEEGQAGPSASANPIPPSPIIRPSPVHENPPVNREPSFEEPGALSYGTLQEMISNAVDHKVQSEGVRSQAYTRPYSRRIQAIHMPTSYHPPKFQQFSGDDNPKQHVAHFIETCNNAGTDGDLLVKQFGRSLKGNAFDWFIELPAESIDSWEQLESEFLSRFYSTKRTVTLVELTNLKQRQGEKVIEYINCWRNLSLNYKESTSLSTQTSIDMCIRGMNWTLVYFLQSRKPRDFQELVTKAHNMEILIQEKGEGKAPLTEADKKPKFIKKEYKAPTKEAPPPTSPNRKKITVTQNKNTGKAIGSQMSIDFAKDRNPSKFTLKDRQAKTYPFRLEMFQACSNNSWKRICCSFQKPKGRKTLGKLQIPTIANITDCDARSHHLGNRRQHGGFPHHLRPIIFQHQNRESRTNNKAFIRRTTARPRPRTRHKRQRRVASEFSTPTPQTGGHLFTPSGRKQRREGKALIESADDIHTCLQDLSITNAVHDDLDLPIRSMQALIKFVAAKDDWHAEVEQLNMWRHDEPKIGLSPTTLKEEQAIEPPQIKEVHSTSISFNESDMLLGERFHNRPLFVSGAIKDRWINRILLDSGSTVNILPIQTLKNVGLVANDLQASSLMIQGFNQEGQRALGTIRLELQIGDMTSHVLFHVIDARTSYNILLGRPWLHNNKVVPSTLHQCAKYYSEEKDATSSKAIPPKAVKDERINPKGQNEEPILRVWVLPQATANETGDGRTKPVTNSEKSSGARLFNSFQPTWAWLSGIRAGCDFWQGQCQSNHNQKEGSREKKPGRPLLENRHPEPRSLAFVRLGQEEDRNPNISRAKKKTRKKKKQLLSIISQLTKVMIQPLRMIREKAAIFEEGQATIDQLKKVNLEETDYMSLLNEYKDIFAWSYTEMPGLDPTVAIHKLAIKSGVKPIKQSQRQFYPELVPEIEKEVDKLLKADFIREVKYPSWIANIVPVKKKNGQIRVCVDFRDLNKACPKDDFPLPITELMVDATTGHEALSFMDGSSGYNKIRMDPRDEEKTTFRTPKGIFCYKVMPFGLKNAGATYQRAMQTIFDDFLHKFVECYVDNVVVKTKSRGDHLRDLRAVFERLRRHQLKMNPLKCAFGVSSGKFLGFVVRHRGIEIDQTKIDVIQQMPEPKTFHLMKKDTPFEMYESCRRAFQNIKDYLMKPPVLMAPTSGKPLLLYIAAQEKSLGALLAQNDDQGKERPLYYLSRTMVGAELNYSPIEKTCLALILSIQKQRHYLLAHSTNLISRADPLKSIMSRPMLSGRLAKWALLLSEFEINFIPQKAIKGQGLANFLADHPIPAEWENVRSFPGELKARRARTKSCAQILLVQQHISIIDPTTVSYSRCVSKEEGQALLSKHMEESAVPIKRAPNRIFKLSG
ncbi:hypothetical protein H6P81_002671 [Aristolochia fimbriata]|uniref:RNA-directed DNA polymerase n=1 Tax=Aristolochia fimbriata TaxID=158543 RepID=A0AAV7FEZ4_ARIFI|nr:hypothetical protein H6P81_002671 [Aristolochia fimbriata]